MPLLFFTVNKKVSQVVSFSFSILSLTIPSACVKNHCNILICLSDIDLFPFMPFTCTSKNVRIDLGKVHEGTHCT